jgi:hypothetical protein
MAKPLLRILNTMLLIVAVPMIGEVAYKWNKLRPRTVYGVVPVDCGDVLDSDAQYLALVCAAVINQEGSLPQDPREESRMIADNASKLGFTWPGNFQLNSAGQICDCAGKPFQISVFADRVAVTSDSLYGYYFAGLKNATEVHEQ